MGANPDNDHMGVPGRRLDNRADQARLADTVEDVGAGGEPAERALQKR